MSTAEERAAREAQLREFYAREVTARATKKHGDQRVERRTAFVELLRREDRRTVLEIGCGTGQDGRALADHGLAYTGVDLTPESVDYCRSLGLEAQVASALELPFPDATFEAGWTMSTIMHLAPDDQARAIDELARVLRPGAPFAIGVWGNDAQSEEIFSSEFGDRYFAALDDDNRRAMLSRVGTIEQFVTWGDEEWHYQWALVRTTGPSA